MRTTINNQQQLEIIISDVRKALENNGRLNVSYEPAHKERTLAQMGFVFSALISNITDYLQNCGFVVDQDDVRYFLYDEVARIVPEMTVDKQIFGGRPRIRHIGEMDRTLCSKFIDGVFTVLDTNPIFEGLKLHPSIAYNWLFHIENEEIQLAKSARLPERDPEYLDYIRTLPCMLCGIQHRSQAHHAKVGEHIGMAIKTEDFRAIPLCPHCHLGIAHGTGFKEAMSWLPYDLDVVTRLCYLRWKNKKIIC